MAAERAAVAAEVAAEVAVEVAAAANWAAAAVEMAAQAALDPALIYLAPVPEFAQIALALRECRRFPSMARWSRPEARSRTSFPSLWGTRRSWSRRPVGSTPRRRGLPGRDPSLNGRLAGGRQRRRAVGDASIRRIEGVRATRV